MSDDAHILDLLPAYALDSLDEDEQVLVSKHLSGCPACRNELQLYRSVKDHLALAVPAEASTPVDLKGRLMNRIQAPPEAMFPPSAQTSWWQSLKNLLTWQTGPGWGAASLALILVLVVGNLLLWQQVNQSNDTPTLKGMQAISLINTQAAPDANGVLIVSSDGEYGSLVVENLPLLAPEQRYQIWLVQNNKIDSGAIFDVDHDGYRAIEIIAPDDLGNYSAFSITIEPAEGSLFPTGDEVLTSAGFSLIHFQ